MLYHPDTDDCGHKNRRRNRSSEQCRKKSCHSGHRCDLLILLIEAEHLPDVVPDISADLQRGTLSAGGTAEQMGENCSDKNRRYQPEFERISLNSRVKDSVGSDAG